MKVTIDRFEKDYAVVEIAIGKFASISKILIPNAKEGDVINIEIDRQQTLERKKYIEELMNDLFEE